MAGVWRLTLRVLQSFLLIPDSIHLPILVGNLNGLIGESHSSIFLLLPRDVDNCGPKIAANLGLSRSSTAIENSSNWTK